MKTVKVISNSWATIIIDMPITYKEAFCLKRELSKLFNAFCTINGKDVLIVNVLEEIKSLKRLIFTLKPSLTDTLFLFPGQSAQFIRSLHYSCIYKSENVFAKRLWIPGSEPRVLMGSIQSKQLIDTTLKQIIVVDDVISSGTTLSLLYRRNAWKYPNAKWNSIALLTRKEQLSHYEHILSCYKINDVNGNKPPINSLSTLVNDVKIRNDYFKRNFTNPEKVINNFNKIISQF